MLCSCIKKIKIILRNLWLWDLCTMQVQLVLHVWLCNWMIRSLVFFLYEGILYFSHAQRNVKKNRICWICPDKVNNKDDKWEERFGASSSNTLLRSARLGLESRSNDNPNHPPLQKKPRHPPPPNQTKHNKPSQTKLPTVHYTVLSKISNLIFPH